MSAQRFLAHQVSTIKLLTVL